MTDRTKAMDDLIAQDADLIDLAADRIEALSAENEQMRDALKRIASGWPKPMQLARETLDRK